MQDCVMVKAGRIITKKKLKSPNKVADSRLFEYPVQGAKSKRQIVVVICNNADVLVDSIIYENRSRFYRYKELWVCTGAEKKTSDILIQVLVNNLGDHLSSLIILKTHALS